MSKKVSIEIGHGGADPGAVSNNILEKDINLVVGVELKRQLERHGITVLINRVTDVGFKVTDFIAKVKEFAPDVGVSVHVNAFNGAAVGFEVFRNTNAFKTTSNLLCANIEKEVKALGQISRGIKDSPFLMSSLPCPTAYCEMGFMDNPSDYAKFDTSEEQKQFAVAYAKGILAYFGINWVKEGEGAPSPVVPAQPAQPAQPVQPNGSQVLFRVVAGSFSQKVNAEAQVKKLKAAGFDCFIVEYQK